MAVSVVVRPFEPIESALRRFKKACEKNGVGRDASRHDSFMSRGQRRRKKAERARARRRAREAE